MDTMTMVALGLPVDGVVKRNVASGITTIKLAVCKRRFFTNKNFEVLQSLL